MKPTTSPAYPGPRIDLFVELKPSGLLFLIVKIGVGLLKLEAVLRDNRKGFASGFLCGGCARGHLQAVFDQPVCDLAIVQGGSNGWLPIHTLEQRQALLARFGEHIH